MAGSAAASAKSGSSDIVKTRKRSARGRALDRNFLVRLVLLAAGALFVGWLCVRAATLEALTRRNPAAAAAVSPNDPRVALALASIEFRVRKGAVTPATTRRAVEALQQAPLAYDPFLFASLGRLVAGNPQGAMAAIREARRRNPRSSITRLIYLDQTLRAGDVEQSAIEIAVISRLMPQTSRVLVPELARYAVDPQTAPALIKALRPDPKMRSAVLDQLASSGADPSAILKLAASGPAPADTSGVPAWQGRMLNTLIDRGEVGRARTIWASLAQVPSAAVRDAVYDGAFRGAPGPPPFNWSFGQGPAGVAEPTRAPALQVEYYGRAETELASQLLQLRPGRHQLSFTASGNAPSGGGSVAWILTCLGNKAQLGSVAIQKINYTPRRLSLAFSVPSGCAAQWLRLTGTPAEFPAAHSITIADLQIRTGSPT